MPQFSPPDGFQLIDQINPNVYGTNFCWAPDGESLAFSNGDTINLWELRSKEIKNIIKLPPPHCLIEAITFSNDGKYLSFIDGTQNVFILNIDNNKLISIGGGFNFASNMEWAPDKLILAVVRGKTLMLYDLESRKFIREKEELSDAIFCLSWKRDGSQICWGTSNGSIRRGVLGGLQTGSKVHTQTISCLTWSPDGKVLASGSYDRSVNLGNRQILKGHRRPVCAVSFSFDNSLLASLSLDGIAKVWRVLDRNCVSFLDLKQLSSTRSNLMFHPHDNYFATPGPKGNGVIIWQFDINYLSNSIPIEEKLYMPKDSNQFEKEYQSAMAEVRLMEKFQSNFSNNPTCYITYAWGIQEEENWVKDFVKELEKQGIELFFDKWSNSPGASLPRFIDNIEKCNLVVIVGTPNLKLKHKNTQNQTIVSQELEIIQQRVINGESIIPIILKGNNEESLPIFLQKHISLDFREDENYYKEIFKLILGVYKIPQRNIEDFVEKYWL